ncbi:MAG: Rpn family recombination-promoting nuclease/putative transposase [Desulfovibrionaceae bacterium]|nr:Rpn family recombination-promoting nuclease/putative transposase [Desulfovibrionaceae bacterium]
MPKQHHQHDINYKNLFTNPDMVASLLRSFAPADVVADMDFSSLEPFPSEHITEDLRERHSDIVWRIRMKDSYCYFLFLLEFQSTEDWWMAVRILAYTALLWQKVIKAEKLKDGDKLPPVFPLVLYNGGTAWKAPTDLRELLSPHGKALEPYQPQQQYFLLDAGRVPEEDLARTNEIATLLIRFERTQAIGEFIQLLTELCTLLPPSERLHLHRAFISWLGKTVFNRTQISEDILHCSTIQEARSMLADIAPHWEQTFMEKGRNEGISIGRSEGISIGETLGIKKILQEILTHRFGALPNDVMASIDGISNANDLKNLTHEAYQVSSFQAFRELLDRICK